MFIATWIVLAACGLGWGWGWWILHIPIALPTSPLEATSVVSGP